MAEKLSRVSLHAQTQWSIRVLKVIPCYIDSETLESGTACRMFLRGRWDCAFPRNAVSVARVWIAAVQKKAAFHSPGVFLSQAFGLRHMEAEKWSGS